MKYLSNFGTGAVKSREERLNRKNKISRAENPKYASVPENASNENKSVDDPKNQVVHRGCRGKVKPMLVDQSNQFWW